MTAKEWLGVMQQAENYNPAMTPLIIKYGEMLLAEAEKARDERIKKLEAEIKRLKDDNKRDPWDDLGKWARENTI